MKRTVLIIDDARTTRTHMRLMLEAQYQCHVAENAEDGLALLKTLPHHPDAILLDVQMPGMGGIECLSRLKGDPATRAIPVVMVTTRGEEDVLARCKEIGCDGYVTKPVQTGDLFSTLGALLRARG